MTSGLGGKPLMMVFGWVTNIEEMPTLPGLARWFEDLCTFTRIIIFDKRGVGLSDRVNEHELPGLQDRIEDIRSIMDSEQIEKVTLFGISEGGPIALAFAYHYPELVESVILFGSFARWIQTPSYPIGIPRTIHDKTLQAIDTTWGQPVGLQLMAPSLSGSTAFQKTWASFLRKSASPGTAKAFYQMNLSIDVRHLLPNIPVPVLVFHRKGDRLIPFKMGKYVAEHLPNASLRPLEGSDHLPWLGKVLPITAGIAQFMGEEFKPHREVLEEGKLQIDDLDTLHTIKTYLSTNYLDEFTIEELCYRFNINSFKLKYGFKQLFGKAVMQFIREARLKHADKLLKETRLSIKEIAYEIGYQYPESFSKAYSRYFDSTPSEIRD